jgi:hypothetical protein
MKWSHNVVPEKGKKDNHPHTGKGLPPSTATGTTGRRQLIKDMEGGKLKEKVRKGNNEKKLIEVKYL